MTTTLSALTLRGRCLFAAGAALLACALLLGQADLLRVSLLVLVLPLVATASVARTRYLLTCTRSVEPPRVPVGKPADVRLRLENVSPLPSRTMLMEDELPFALGGRPRFVLDRVEPQGTRDVAYSVSTDTRGRHRVGPLSVRLTDPFGLVELRRAFTSTDDVVVTPVVQVLPPVRLGGSRGGAGDSVQTAMAAGSDDVSTREYRRGDDLRKVHWRSTARVGELMVRQEEQPLQQRATLVLDCRSTAHAGKGKEASFEWSVGAAASIGTTLLRNGYLLTVTLHDGRLLLPADLPVTEGSLLDALASVQLGGGGMTPAAPSAGVLVALLGRVRLKDAEALSRVRAARRIALVLDVATWTGASPGTQAGPTQLSGSGWNVVEARSGDDLRSLWPRAGASVTRVGAG